MHMTTAAAFRMVRFAALALAITSCVPPPVTPVNPINAPPVLLDQGPHWTATARRDFYSRDQGSRIMPLRWMQALKGPNGELFLADSLGRYGYLPNNDIPGMPIGFTVTGPSGGEAIGMTCSACHTRQITVGNIAYRVDGGPAIVDFQNFLADLDRAVDTVLANDAAFSEFAQTVLGHVPTPEERASLHQEVGDWFYPYHTLITRALPSNPWGPARLDAVGMIFNRLTGLDIGPAPTHVIADNIQRADAPARYPFLWNSPVQDKTQWPGFADNGNDILGLSRNLGEVYGVFAVYRPKKDPWHLLGFDYLNENSANFRGLEALEGLVKKIGPPKWPFAIDTVLAKQGEAIYGWPKEQGGCAECHEIRPGATRFFEQKTWATPIQDVGTDSREYDILGWTAQSGVLSGAEIPFVISPLQPRDKSINILGVSVVGSILQKYVPLAAPQVQARRRLTFSFTPEMADLKGAFPKSLPPPAYESRVLQGTWAAAPYLHNGSVPTLTDLLKPASERPSAFQVGPAYDPERVGLAAQQTMFNYTLKTTDCGDRNSGNSRCGHEFGTQLSPAQKRALLEYLKVL
jgi:mono/diheme cytochrome c family protein